MLVRNGRSYAHGVEKRQRITCIIRAIGYVQTAVTVWRYNMSDQKLYNIRLTREELLKVRVALVNIAKEWDEKDDPKTAQHFRDVLKQFAFEDTGQ